MDNLEELAQLIQRRNLIDAKIASLINRPAHSGHIAEYVAAAIFDIELNASAATATDDGRFKSGPLTGKSVNIKYGSRRAGTLNLIASPEPHHHPDTYLVLTGPGVIAAPSRGSSAPWVIRSVYLFASSDLLETLKTRGIQPKTAASVRRDLWNAAMIYPRSINALMNLTEAQRNALDYFSGTMTPSLVDQD